MSVVNLGEVFCVLLKGAGEPRAGHHSSYFNPFTHRRWYGSLVGHFRLVASFLP
jgi:hypothetical protein